MESEKMVCTNHYQSDTFREDSLNKENILKSDSHYRYMRVEELLQKYTPLDIVKAVTMLRDEKGHADKFLGYGNPKAINQLLAHHSIVLKPQQKQFWVSTQDYQMGDFIHYDFDAVFRSAHNLKEITSDNNRILPDTSFTEERRVKMHYFRRMSHTIQSSLLAGKSIDLKQQEVETFILSNPESYMTYTLLGDYYREKKEWQQARRFYEKALTKEVASKKEIEAITGKMTSTLSTTTNR
jgi:tetratricopeptide (TPR) repeat protein